jgi:hypothetical protein
MIHFLDRKASADQVAEMLGALEVYIKLAVDVQQRTVAGGGTLHADCEAVLLENGSMQENIWGADWLPHTRQVTFESLINIRPRQNNLSLEIQDQDLRSRVEAIVRAIFDE